jgi:dihydrofolate reductase
MYETMVYWETAHLIPNQPKVILDWAHHWQAAEKIVFSRTLPEPASQRTLMERKFDPERVRQLKDEAKQDLAIAGPELAALAVQAGLVDEFQLIVCPVIVGGGKRFFPDGVRFDLTLIEERLLGDGVVLLRYAVGN